MTLALRDLLQGFRLTFRAPGFAAATALTLALGIGATTTLYSVVHAVLLAPLPFPESDRLIQVWRSELPALTYGSASYARYLDWRANQRPFVELGAWAPRGFTLAGVDGPERVTGATASASFFIVMGARPALGRWFTDDEDRSGGEPVAVVSDGLWRRRFGASPSAIGSTVRLDGQPYTVVGIAPPAYGELWRTDVWIPLGQVADAANRGSNFLLSFGRLRPGTALAEARRSLDGELAPQLTRDHPEDRYTFTARPLHEVVTEGAARGLWVLLGATALLLLIACTNVANLLLARAVVRERDLAVRTSLGASRGQLVGQILGETTAMGLLGSVAGLGLAWALLRTFVALAPATFPRLAAIGLDPGVLLFAIALAVATGALAALAPALHLWRTDAQAVMRAAATRSVTGARARAASRVLVVAEVAIALALLTTAGVLTKSLLRLQEQDLGVTRAPVLTFAVGLPPLVADGDAAVARFHTAFTDRLRTLPGVTHVSAINMLPIAATGYNGPVRRPDQTGERDGVPVTEVRAVMDGYVDAMGLRLLAGRAIDTRDRDGAPPVVVVNDTVASRLWPALTPSRVVGQQVRVPFDSGDGLREVVGVVAGVRSRRPDLLPDPEIHVPFAQVPQPSMSYVVRADGDPTRLTPQIRAALAAMTADVAIAAVRTFDDVVATATRTSGLLSWLSVLFAGLAALLAVVGVYGVMSCTVAQRERELAIRAAMGATRPMLLGLVVREGLAMSVAGLGLGAAAAWAGSGVLGSLLYEVSATDAAVFAAAAMALATVTLVGAAAPAARAARVEPVTALRAD
ncbi:MAG: ADOP family duplicated permease [Vicinamibacterales bacterium]